MVTQVRKTEILFLCTQHVCVPQIRLRQTRISVANVTYLIAEEKVPAYSPQCLSALFCRVLLRPTFQKPE